MKTTHTLVCPFLTDNPEFARGVEFGLLYARMRDSDEPVADYFFLSNQDQVLLLASRLGWSVVEMEVEPSGWLWCVLEKKPGPVI